MDRKELFERLIALDKEVYMVLPDEQRLTMVIVGGGALIIQGYLNRVTLDIDMIEIYYKVLEPIFEKYDVNFRSNVFCECIPENYYKRLVKVNLETKIIDYYTLSLEDLVIMKLFSFRSKDKKDVRTPEVVNNLNWDLLEEIVASGEANNTFNERLYKEFLYNYEEYVKECKK